MDELPTYSSMKVTASVFIHLFSLVFREMCPPFLVLQPELKRQRYPTVTLNDLK